MTTPASSAAFLIRSVKTGESDQVLTLLTRDFGKLSCIAKNSVNSRRRFSASLQPFCKFEAALRLRSGSMAVLESAAPLKIWPGLLGRLETVSAGYRLLELSGALEESGSVHAEFFDALEDSFSALNAAHDCESSVLRSEARLLQLSGWAPRLDACVNCRREAPFVSPRLSLSEGGLLCQHCQVEGGSLSLGPGAGRALQRLFHDEEGSVEEAAYALRRFIEYQLGKALKTDAFDRRIRTAL